MRVIYLKNIPEWPSLYSCYWKVFQKDQHSIFVLTVNNDCIEYEVTEDFFEHVSFIKNKLCDGIECIEISKEEFCRKYNYVMNNINNIYNLY